MTQKTLLICTNYRANPNHTSCAARGSKQLVDSLKLAMQAQNIKMEVEETTCMGHCQQGPNVRLTPNGAFFHKVSVAALDAVIIATKTF